MSAIRALLAGLIDYAGLFPPAGLDMTAAVRNYAEYRQGEHAWALGRFVVPWNRLGEFAGMAAENAFEGRVSVLGAPAGPLDTRGGMIDTIELRAERAADIRQAMNNLPEKLTPYFEIPIERDPLELIETLAEAGARAKVRTGGLTAEMFPSTSGLARFLYICARRKVPFKATAGLHHPVRSVHRFTYEPDSPAGPMHGFINLFLAASLLFCGADQEETIPVLEETSAGAFHFDETGVSCRGRRLTTEQLCAAREKFANSFGSCSFEEPINDLKALGWL